MDLAALRFKAQEFLEKLPFDYLAWDPYITHFAMALPFTALYLQIFSFIMPNKGFQGSSDLLFSSAILSVLLAYIREIPPFDGEIDIIYGSAESYIMYAIALWALLRFVNSFKSDISRHFIIFAIFIILAFVAYKQLIGFDI